MTLPGLPDALLFSGIRDSSRYPKLGRNLLTRATLEKFVTVDSFKSGLQTPEALRPARCVQTLRKKLNSRHLEERLNPLGQVLLTSPPPHEPPANHAS